VGRTESPKSLGFLAVLVPRLNDEEGTLDGVFRRVEVK
jgi:hypothetical protein